MIDVHPPHETVHSWKDFSIHMVAICLGLLIAIGLEQCVEALHRRHERAQLQADLREEVKGNLYHIRDDIHILDRQMIWLTSWNAAVESARDRRVPLSAFPPQDSIAGIVYARPSIAVWSVAEHDATVGLVPRPQAQAFGRIASSRDGYIVACNARQAMILERKAFEARFANAANPMVPVYARMTPDQLDAYSALLMREFEGTRDEERFLLYFFGGSRAVLAGKYTEQDVLNGMYSEDVYLWSDPATARPALSMQP